MIDHDTPTDADDEDVTVALMDCLIVGLAIVVSLVVLVGAFAGWVVLS